MQAQQQGIPTAHGMGQLTFDEYGNPFIIVQDQSNKQRLKGLDAHKSNILAALAVTTTIRSSLGPKGMDKIITSPDGEITVSNDGATILDQMNVEHQIAKLLVELSKSQDNEIGDGTTGVVIICGGLLEEAMKLLEKGIHPLVVADGFEKACEIACARVEEIAKTVDIQTTKGEFLLKAAMTSLSSKVVSSKKRELAQMAVDSVLSVADLARKDVNFDLIKLECKVGGKLEETKLFRGVVLDKEFSHPQMSKELSNAKIAILTCPFEPPKPKTKNTLEISSAEAYRELAATEQRYFTDMVAKIEASGANLVICQWGFDDEANHLLYQKGIHAVRWVGGVEIELIAIATGGRIVPRFEDLTPEKLGFAGKVKEVQMGTTGKESLLVIEECKNSKAVTMVIRGGNQMAVDEAKRSIYDAICSVRNLIRDSRIVPGGGASELAASSAVAEAAEKVGTVEQYAMRGFADALEVIPTALAENSGLSAIKEVANLKALHVKHRSGAFGVDCMQTGTNDMWEQNVYEAMSSKVGQLRLATQVVKMILKIDDVIAPSEF
jgi:T-complex protein 1 subunit epsilon